MAFETKNKVDVLLLFRGFACFMVVLCHVIGGFDIKHPVLPLIAGYDITWLIRTTGALGVWMFFILSGYLMGKVFYTKRYLPTWQSATNFYRNRLLRIYPLYVCSIGAVWLMNIHAFPLNWPNLKTLLALLSFSYYGETPFPNTLLWTISTEFRFYLLVPLAYLVAQRLVTNKKRYVMAMIITLGIWFSYRFHLYVRHAEQPDFYVQWIHKAYIPLKGNLDMFLSGFLLNFLVQHRKLGKAVTPFAIRMRKAAALLVLGALFVFYNYASYQAQLFMAPIYAPIFYIGMQTLVILGCCFFIYQFETKTYHRVPAVQWSHIRLNPMRSLEIFGILTYGIYLWHMPMMQTFDYFNFSISNPTILLVAKLLYTMVLATAVSTLTYFLIEKQFEKKKRAVG